MSMLVWLVPAALFFTLFAFALKREWRATTELLCGLERSGTGAFSTRIAYHWCQRALKFDERRQTAGAALQSAREFATQAAWSRILAPRWPR
jgi:hypothetical protein